MNKQSKLFIFSEKLSEVDKKAASKSSFGTVYFASNTFSKVRRDRAKSLLGHLLLLAANRRSAASDVLRGGLG